MIEFDPKTLTTFEFVEARYLPDTTTAELVYRFDRGPELVERIVFPGAPALAESRRAAFESALQLLHLIAGISYYKAAVPGELKVSGDGIDAGRAVLLDELYLHGLGEFAHQNQLDLRGRIQFPVSATARTAVATSVGLPRHNLVPIGGGKDSLVTLEALRTLGEPITAVQVGGSPLIARVIADSGVPALAIGRELSPHLFALNRAGAYNGHIPVTAINSAILVVASLLYGFDAIVFSNERSASSANLVKDGFAVNHQWSKGFRFEQLLRAEIARSIASDLNYFSALRALSELAVTQRFAKLDRYFDSFSSCNRNFKILGDRPTQRWCGECPKCHFVFLGLAPFLSKTKLLGIFGQNLLDRADLAQAFDGLLEVNAQLKPFECVGEGRESRAALAELSRRAEWREDALVRRFVTQIAPSLDAASLALEPLLLAEGEHFVPPALAQVLHAVR
ncbi:MAG: endonuclease domain-containing protein [Ahniella sp.]|nr:endonuclease domain-containing protein [Ahniella sp.]